MSSSDLPGFCEKSVEVCPPNVVLVIGESVSVVNTVIETESIVIGDAEILVLVAVNVDVGLSDESVTSNIVAVIVDSINIFVRNVGVSVIESVVVPVDDSDVGVDEYSVSAGDEVCTEIV